MSKHSWHITRKGQQVKKVRHYKHLIEMYKFVSRNRAMFAGKTLTIYDWGHVVADIEWDDILVQVDNGIKELEARKWLKTKYKN